MVDPWHALRSASVRLLACGGLSCSLGLIAPARGTGRAAAYRGGRQRRRDHQPGPDRPAEPGHRDQRPAQRRGDPAAPGAAGPARPGRREAAAAGGQAARPDAVPTPRSTRRWTTIAQRNQTTVAELSELPLPNAASIRARCASSCAPRSPGSRCVGREVRPRIVVTQEQIDLAIKRSAARAGDRELLLSEILLPVYDRAQEASVTRGRPRVSSPRCAAAPSFAALARQVSAAASAQNGGDLGWVRVSAITPDLRDQIAGPAGRPDLRPDRQPGGRAHLPGPRPAGGGRRRRPADRAAVRAVASSRSRSSARPPATCATCAGTPSSTSGSDPPGPTAASSAGSCAPRAPGRQAARPAFPVRPLDPAPDRGRGRRPRRGSTVLEVGPGPGGLTRALLDAGAGRLVAVERDPRFVRAAARAGGRGRRAGSSCCEADALELDPCTARRGRRPVRIVANLPYNVATPLLFGWFERLDCIERMVLMFQKEVALRLAAAPGHGRLWPARGAWRSACAGSSALFDLPPAAFTPPPKVSSSVVRLTPRPGPAVARAARGARRRSPRPPSASAARCCARACARFGHDPRRLLAAAGIEETRRAEELDIDEFCIGLAELHLGRSPARAAPARSNGTARRRWWRRARCSST